MITLSTRANDLESSALEAWPVSSWVTAYVYLRVSCVFRPSRSGLGPVKINMSLGGTGGEAKTDRNSLDWQGIDMAGRGVA